MRKWMVPAGIAIVVIGLGTVALLRDPVQLDPNTPEGTVQEYLAAISVEDYARAFDVLHPASFEGCDPDDLARSAPREPFSATFSSEPGFFGGRDFVEERPPGFEPTAPDERVNVILRFGGDGPFDSGWEQWESFGLITDDGFWWIVGDPWPYFSWSCRRGDF